MPALDDSVRQIVESLATTPGEPAEPPGSFRSILRAAIAARSGGPTADRRLGAMAKAGLDDPAALAEAPALEVTQALRDAGKKADERQVGPLRRVAAWWVDIGGAEAIAGRSTEAIRDDLRALRGIGAATAEAILLDGLDRPAYPLDRATYRVLARHGWIDPASEFDEARAVVEQLGGGEAASLRRLAGGFERIGRTWCRPTVAHCRDCPLRGSLPDGGPYELEPDGEGVE